MFISISEICEPLYKGSVQNLYGIKENNSLIISKTTEKGSVFDVGHLFSINNSDVNRSIFRHCLYSQINKKDIWIKVKNYIDLDPNIESEYKNYLLSSTVLNEFISRGAKTHHVGMIDLKTGEVISDLSIKNPSSYNVIEKYKINKPLRCHSINYSIFDYSKFFHIDNYVVPLESIVRFGVTKNSSILSKYSKLNFEDKSSFLKSLNLKSPLKEWSYLDFPINTLTSKFEPEDRSVKMQEAFNMSGLNYELFSNFLLISTLSSFVVKMILEEIGLNLWDIKWELAKSDNSLVIVDTIDTDSFRATKEVKFENKNYLIHFNKQAIRNYFNILHPDWINDINSSKSLARTKGLNFVDILNEGQKTGKYLKNPKVDDSFISIQDGKMSVISKLMLNKIDKEEALKKINELSIEEINFYKIRNVFEKFQKMNLVSQ